MKIAIVDYGMGNLHSVQKSLEAVNQIGADIYLCHDPDQLIRADKIVFPGQGAMPDCMANIQREGLDQALLECAQTHPFFGICIGAQLLLEESEEGPCRGLGIFKGKVRKFTNNLHDADGHRLKVPHMGWNTVEQTQKHPIFHGVKQLDYFYFVHSFYFEPDDSSLTLAQSHYPTPFSCVIGRDNLFATQFHTEKSHQAGLQMMKNFLAWDGCV